VTNTSGGVDFHQPIGAPDHGDKEKAYEGVTVRMALDPTGLQEHPNPKSKPVGSVRCYNAIRLSSVRRTLS
jgi:hypothetical protein